MTQTNVSGGIVGRGNAAGAEQTSSQDREAECKSMVAHALGIDITVNRP